MSNNVKYLNYGGLQYFLEKLYTIFAPKTKPSSNEIWYTSSDGLVVTPYSSSGFGANIASNTYDGGKGVITFDGDVTSIGGDAFYGCSSLASITIPDSVTSIGAAAFYGCSSLASITIPDSVTSIGESAFEDCSSLTSITIPDGVTWIGNYAFWGCSSLTSITIPDGVTSIGFTAFRDCSSLTSVTIPDSVTSIGGSAFSGCSSLTSITIPDSVTSIGGSAFYDCTSLASVTIPDSVTSIGNHTFHECSSLTSITIPDSVTSIGDYAFINCTSLTSIYCKPITPPALNTNTFNNTTINNIYVPVESVDSYKSTWSDYANSIVGCVFEDENLVSGENIKTINGESILGSGDITVSGAYPEVSHGTSDTTFTLTPNVFHVWGEVTSLTLTFGDEMGGVANEFLFQFTSGSTATTLTLPDTIKWANDSAPTIEADKIYQISILKGLASVLVF